MMLVLSRRIGESIVIGDNVTITIIDLYDQGGKVRLGIQAPKEVPVHRQEVYDSLKADGAVKSLAS